MYAGMKFKSSFRRFILLAVILIMQASYLSSQVGDGFPITEGPGERIRASVAFDGTHYMVAWGNLMAGVYVTRVTLDGVVLDPDGILLTNTGRLNLNPPRIAFDEENYLVVWDQGMPASVFGARISSEGEILDPEGFLISPPDAANQLYPAVAFNGTNYLVVWYRSSGEMVCARVSCEGEVLDPDGIVISPIDPATRFPRPSIASNGEDFLVVWEDGPPDKIYVEAARVSSEGEVLDPEPIAIAPPNQRDPSVAFDGANYLVVWEVRRDSTSDIYGARVTSEGEVLDLEGIPISTGPFPQFGYHPLAAFDGTNYFVVWTDLRNLPINEVWGSWVTPDGDVLNPEGIQISAGENHRFARHLTFSGQNGLLLWQQGSSGSNANIYGLLIPLSTDVKMSP